MRRCAALLLLAFVCPVGGQVPTGFVDEVVIDQIESPAGFKFAPDGRLFFTERITGDLRVATHDDVSGVWLVDPEPYASFGVPPERHRSSGLRDVAFDPAFETNGLVYAIYMNDNPRHNRVVRIGQDPGDPSRALAGETVLLELPFNSSQSSGSHNGAAVEFGADGHLYIATGDGWNGGDPVQSLGTYTGKLFRIASDGSIPADNPFFEEATGPLRAIYALGLRNPYSMTFDEPTGRLFINEANGSRKTRVLEVQPGANYGHQGGGDLGTATGGWLDVDAGGGEAQKLVTGGAFYPSDGPLPVAYHGRSFFCLWGSNGSSTGVINVFGPDPSDPGEVFATNVAKPVNIRVGPDGWLYYMSTTYETSNGRIHRIRFDDVPAAATPAIDPPGGVFIGSVDVTLTSDTDGTSIRYTLDATDPTELSILYDGTPIQLGTSTTLRARAFGPDGLSPSGVAESVFEVCADASCNEPPVALTAGEITVPLGRQVLMSGSASSDPDTDEGLLNDGWSQTAGYPVELLNDDETVSYSTPPTTGWYRFEYSISDGLAQDTATLDVFVVPCVDVDLTGVIGAWRFDAGNGGVAIETGSGAFHGVVDQALFTTSRTQDSGGAIEFDGIDDAVDIGTLDIDADAMSMGVWIRPDDFDQMDGRIVSKATGVNADDHLWMLSTISNSVGHGARFRLQTDSGGTATLIANDVAISAGVWTHLAATYDGAMMRLYQNGVEIASMPKTGRVATDPSVAVAIGNQPQRTRPFDGRIDDLVILGRALAADEIGQLAAPTRPFDLDANGITDAADLLAFDGQPVDLNGDGVINDGDRACLAAFVRRRAARDLPASVSSADVNQDGELDFFDLLLYLIPYDAGQPWADFDADGVLTAGDLQEFLLLLEQ